jgi:hypothetical protein
MPVGSEPLPIMAYQGRAGLPASVAKLLGQDDLLLPPFHRERLEQPRERQPARLAAIEDALHDVGRKQR